MLTAHMKWARSAITSARDVGAVGRLTIVVCSHSGAPSGIRFWKNFEPCGAVGEALQQHRPVAHRPHHRVADRHVVVDEIELGVAAGREEDLVGAGDRERPPGDRDLARAIAHNSNRIRSRQLPSGEWGRRWSRLRCRARSSRSTSPQVTAVRAGPAADADRVDEDAPLDRRRRETARSSRLLVAVGQTVMAGAAVASIAPGVGASEGGGRGRDGGSRPAFGPTSPRCIARHDVGLDAAPARRGRPAAHGRSAHRPRERRRPRRRGLVRRVRPGGHRRPAPPPARRRADRAHAGRRDDRRHRHGQRRTCSRATPRRSSRCRTTTPCSPARRARRTTARRTACSSSPSRCGCRSCSSPRAAAAGPATPTASASAGSTAWRSCTSASSAGSCRSSASTPGYCFAGNAAILGCCDVVIATEDSNIGMGGPAMIEGGGLGVFEPTDVGPMSVQQFNGVVDIAVADEAEAVAVAKQYLSYFQGPIDAWDAPDQRELRRTIPEDRKRSYDVRDGDRRAVRHRLGAGAAPRLRPRDGHRARPGRGPARRRRRQQPRPPRRRDRQRRRRQGGAVPAAVRRVRHPHRHARRHAGDDGRARRSRRPRWSATAAGCSSPAPTSRCR